MESNLVLSGMIFTRTYANNHKLNKTTHDHVPPTVENETDEKAN